MAAVRSEKIGKVQRKAKLATDAGAGVILAPNKAEAKRESGSNIVLAAQHDLQLAASKSVVVGDTTINLRAQSPTRIEIVQKGGTARENVAAGCFDANHAGACVACEEITGIYVESRCGGDGFLDDEVEPIVVNARAQLLLPVAGREFNVKRRAQSGEV